MPFTNLPMGFSFYQSESITFSAQRCINWIPVVAESGAANPRALMQPPGMTVYSNASQAVNRGSWEMDQVPYFVYGTELLSVDSEGVVTDHGDITAGTRVSMADNGQFLVIVVPGDSAWVYDNVADSLTEITDPNFRTASTVVYIDGFFVFSAADGSVFFNSALNDPFTYNALDFGTAEINPDKIVALHVNHNELFVLGGKTAELFQNVGGAGFPFQRIPGANIQKGIYARFSSVEFNQTFCYLGGGKNEKAAVWMVSGSSAVSKISTDSIDAQIQKFSEDEIANSFAMTYSRNGQYFAIFTFDSQLIPSKTFVYNATASALSQQKIWFELQTGVTDGRWRVNSIVQAYGRLLLGDDRSEIIGDLNSDDLSYYDDPIFRSSTTQPFINNTRTFAGAFEATFQAGVGLTNGLDPMVRLDFSDDGGHTFSSESKRSIGKIGKYGQRSVWQRQGEFPVARSIRLTMTDPVVGNLIRLGSTFDVGAQ